MRRKFFGTDGVRGPYGDAQINEIFAARLVRAAAAFFRQKNGGLHRAVVGRDTRFSGESLSAAIIAALVESGLEVFDAGVAPTPAIAGSMRELQADIGIVVTASHNAAADNGFKFFSEGGHKLTDEDELGIEKLLEGAEAPAVSGGFMRRAAVSDMYIERMRKALAPDSLKGWRIAVDAAHGATAVTTPEVLMSLGADLVLLGHRPDGVNINDGVGAQHPQAMAEAVKASGARLGIAHDGDGDRVVLCDETGEILDGDDMLAILAIHALRDGTLKGKTLVATIQSNAGLDRAVQEAGGRVIRTNVGDRYVVDEMFRGGFNIGGETSGHIVLLDASPTGDGLASALKVLQIMQASGEPLSRLRQCWKRFPQASASLAVRKKIPFEQLTLLPKVIAEAEAVLGTRGRVLVRYSGTEPKLRFLVEGEDAAQVPALLEGLRMAASTELT